jgi:hypothetical protein
MAVPRRLERLTFGLGNRCFLRSQAGYRRRRRMAAYSFAAFMVVARI